jgi:hypothetical protein
MTRARGCAQRAEDVGGHHRAGREGQDQGTKAEGVAHASLIKRVVTRSNLAASP